jgi:excisionase family DNA binding protein
MGRTWLVTPGWQRTQMDQSRITASVAEFCRLSGIGRSFTYQMIANGSLESVTIGRRRLIIVDSYRRLIARRQEEQAAGAPLIPSPNPLTRQDRPKALAIASADKRAEPSAFKNGTIPAEKRCAMTASEIATALPSERSSDGGLSPIKSSQAKARPPPGRTPL